MSRIYTVEFENVAVAAVQDFFELTAADDRPVEIVGISFGQISDVGDAQEEMLRFRVIRGHTTSGTGGAAPTPQPVKNRDGTAGFTAETNNVTTQASAGTAVNLFSDAWNIRVGYTFWFPEGCEPDTDQGAGLLVVRLMAAPADSINLSGTLFVRER